MDFGRRRWVKFLSRVLGQQGAFVVTRWGFGKSVATLLARLGSQKLALGAVATGATGLTIHHGTKDQQFAGDVLSSGQEVEWLNRAIEPIWDHLNKGFRKVVVDEVQPALQQRLGTMGLFFQCQFTKLSLGSAAPRFGPVRVTRSPHGLEINVGFCLEGNGLLEFSAGVASVQVCDISVRGSLRVALVPLVDSLNPVGGVSVTCLDKPDIDLTIKTGTTLIPNLYDFVRTTVDDVVANLIVVPNTVAVPMDTFGPVTDICSIRHPAPFTFLRFQVEGASAAGLLPGSVYLEVLLGCETWRSATAKVSRSSRQVEWMEGNLRDFPIYSQDQMLRLRLFGGSSFTGAQLLGSGQVHVRDLLALSKVEVALTDAAAEGENFSVELILDWMPVLKSAPKPKAKEGPVLVVVHAHRASDVKKAEGKHKLRVVAGGHQATSQVGEAPPRLGIEDDALLSLANKLLGKLPLADFADVLGLSVEHCREFALEHTKRRRNRSATEAASWDELWCARARQAASDLAAAREPHFDYACHLLAEHGTVRVELTDEAGTPFASLERDLAQIIAQGGHCEGPFQLGDCTLHGSIRLWKLGVPSRGLHERLLSESTWDEVARA